MWKSMRRRLHILLLFLMVCLHVIEIKQKGLQGLVACSTLSVQVKTGTILNRNYTDANPDFASIPLGDSPSEPTVLFLGIENKNGVYTKIDFSSVIRGGDNSKFTVPGTRGWYILVPDRDKDRVNSNYQVKFIP